MERKSIRKRLVWAAMCLLITGMIVSTGHAQWWTSTSSTSSSTTSSTTTSGWWSSTSSTSSGWWSSTSSTSSSSTSSSSTSSSGSIADPSKTGPNSVCTYTPPANSGYKEAKVYYPCKVSDTVAATTLTSCWTGTYKTIEYLSKVVASHGFIVYAMTPNNNLGNNPEWTSAHKAGIAMLKSENTRTGSSIKGKVNTAKLQVMGHSKGGGGALIAARDLGSAVVTCQALTPYLDNTEDFGALTTKNMVITGTKDSEPAKIVNIYNSLPTANKKILAYFEGLDHMVFSSTGSSALQAKTNKYIVSFMYYYLNGDANYQTYLYGVEHANDVNNGWFYQYANN